MRDLLKSANTKGAKVSSAAIDAAIRNYLPKGVSGEIREFIEKGALIPPDPEALGPCVTLIHDAVPEFELGFDFKKSKETMRVIGVIPESAAWDAGLRDGERLKGWDIEFGSANRKVGVTIDEPLNIRKIIYVPTKKHEPGREPKLPQYRINEAMLKSDGKSCLGWFGI